MAVAVAPTDHLADVQVAVNEARRLVRKSIGALMGQNQSNRITQTKLARVLDISQGQLSQRLKGKLPFSEDELVIIASLFGIKVVDLYDPARAIEGAREVTLWIAEDIHSDDQLELHFGEPPCLVVV